MPDVLSSAPKYSVAHMIVCADKTRQHNSSVAVHYGIGHRILRAQYLGVAHGHNAIFLDIDRPVFNDAVCRINRHHRTIGDQQ